MGERARRLRRERLDRAAVRRGVMRGWREASRHRIRGGLVTYEDEPHPDDLRRFAAAFWYFPPVDRYGGRPAVMGNPPATLRVFWHDRDEHAGCLYGRGLDWDDCPFHGASEIRTCPRAPNPAENRHPEEGLLRHGRSKGRP